MIAKNNIIVLLASISLCGVSFATEPNEIKFSAEQTKQMEEHTQSSFIGMVVEPNPKGLLINNIIPDSPAEKAGIKVGQIITEIEGKSTIGMKIAHLHLMNIGHTSVNLKLLLQDGTSKQMSVSVVHGSLKVRGVKSLIIEPNIGLLKIRFFMNESSTKVKEYLLDFQQKKIRGLIVDVRDNSSSNLDEVKKITSVIVGPNECIWQSNVTRWDNERSIYYDNRGVPLIMRSPNEPPWTTSEGEKLVKCPIVVIINENTECGAELMASALKVRAGAKVIGQKTHGKTTVYEILKSDEGTSYNVKIILRSADGKDIQDKGITPDVELDPNLPNDEVIKKAVNELTKEIEKNRTK